jgi:hypothetical protein
VFSRACISDSGCFDSEKQRYGLRSRLWGEAMNEDIRYFLLSLLGVIISAWCLYHRVHESERLCKIHIAWYPLKEGESESARLEKIKRRMVKGYSILFCIGVVVCLFLGFMIVWSKL